MNRHWWKVCDVAFQPGMHHKLQAVESESPTIQEQAHLEQAVRDNAHLSAHITDAEVCWQKIAKKL